jgi:hypothetical protein
MKYLIILLIISTGLYASAPTDSLIFKNDNIMDGEIKSMDRGVVVVETDYIEWNKIQKINTQTDFFITLSDGRK